MQQFGQFINGQWTDFTPGASFVSQSPASGEALAAFSKGTRADVLAAVDAAEAAFPQWKALPAPKRGEILLRAAQILRDRKEELGRLVSQEMGKVIAEGRGDVQEAIDFLEYIAGEGRRLFGQTTTSELQSKFAMTIRQPIGVVGCITPWNFPIAIPAWKLGAALVAGNTVVFKPASQTPLCATRLVEVLVEAGIPAGVLNLVVGSAQDVGVEIVENPRIRSISFTGGVPAGTDVYVRAARLLKKVELELGGKNPQIIMDDADLDLAVEGVLFGAFGTAGQRCTATSRLLVHEKVYDQVINKLLARTKSLRLGDPLDEETDVGPLSSHQQQRTALEYIEIGKAEGARLLYGGNRLDGEIYGGGFFVEPAIFEAEHGMRITKEEIFGPVLSVIRFRDYEEAVRIANDVDYGLSTSIYTRNVNLAFRAIQDLEAGITYINAPTIGAEVHLPFGGIKNTGNGGREAGTTAIEEFTEIKTVFVDYSGTLQRAQIDQCCP